jgi:tetratricopeptide (TPR) repeat protein
MIPAPRLPATVALLLSLVAIARAETPPPTAEARAIAREHYDKAVSHFNANEYGPAAEEFLAVYKAVPQPALLYNAAQAYRLGGDGPKAVESYRAFLKASPEAKQKADVERRIKELEGKSVVAVKDVPDMSPPPAVVATSTKIGASTGGSDRTQAIAEVIKQNRAGFRACFDKWAKAHKGVDGKVTLTFYLDPDGNLDQPNADEKGFAAPEVAACIEELSRTLKYPKSPSGKFTRFTYPFDFKAAR